MNIQGPEIYYTLPGGIHITETIVNMWILMAVITAICAYLGYGLKDKPESRRQVIAEYIVSKLYLPLRSLLSKNKSLNQLNYKN